MAVRTAWLRVLARAADHQEDLGPCPDCGQNQLEVRYIVNPETRIGYVLLWCGACLHGISVSRAQAPAGMPTWSLGDPASIDGVPDFTHHE
jgi:hypothetical protein